MSVEDRYAIALVVRGGEGPSQERVLFSQRNPSFHNVLGGVWGLGFSRYLSAEDYLLLTGPESNDVAPVLQKISADIVTNKLDNKCELKILKYVTQGDDLRGRTGEPGADDFMLHMVLYEASVEGQLPETTIAYDAFKFLTTEEYIELRKTEAAKGKQCGLCTDLFLYEERLHTVERQYRQEAIQACVKSHTGIFADLWNDPDIITFFSRLPADTLTQFLADKIVEITGSKGKILIVGGGVGRLGRFIAIHNPGMQVFEIDNSSLMVITAHALAQQDQTVNFAPYIADAFSLPFHDSCFDLVISQGFLRHLADYESAFNEMRRVGMKTFIAEANAGNKPIIQLASQHNSPVQEATMNMPRISLFGHLYHRYRHDSMFKEFVDGIVTERRSRGIDTITYLSQIAGTGEGTLYYSEILK